MTSSNLAQATALSAMGLALFVALLAPRADHAAATTAMAAAPAVVAPAWAAPVETGADHVTPEDLAASLLRGDDVLLVDVRPADEFASGFRLAGSVNLDLPRLLGAEGAALLASRPAARVVLVSNGMTHPAQAWTALAARGGRDVRILEDGLDGFRARVLTPPSLRGALTEDAARAAAPSFAAARAAFLAPATPEPVLARPATATATATATAAPLSSAPLSSAPPSSAPPSSAEAPRPPATPAGATYAPDPARLESPTVVSAAWVARRGADVVLLDARVPAEQYAAGHLPGARHVPIEALRSTVDGVPEELRPPEELAALFGSLGVGDETEVVAYADDKPQDATHLVLALVSAGHRRVAVLEGGVSAWKAAGLPFSTVVPVPVPAAFHARPAPDVRRVRAADVAAAMRSGDVPIVDVRPADAFRGEKNTEARPGHIPGSANRPYTDDVVKTDGGFLWRPRADLDAGWTASGAAPGSPVIVSCRTGHQASLAWFTLRYLLGRDDVRWYDGSWKDWAARPELPAATGPAAPRAPEGGR